MLQLTEGSESLVYTKQTSDCRWEPNDTFSHVLFYGTLLAALNGIQTYVGRLIHLADFKCVLQGGRNDITSLGADVYILLNEFYLILQTCLEYLRNIQCIQYGAK